MHLPNNILRLPRSKRRDNLFSIILIALGVLYPALGLASQQAEQIIRVQIYRGQSPAKLTILGGYRILDIKTGESLADSRHLPGVNIQVNSSGIVIAGVQFGQSAQIHSDDPKDLFVNKHPFRGFLEVHAQDNGNQLLIVNHIPMEEYLYGVLFHEVGAWWPAAALESQAIASRTYAMYQRQIRSKYLFDVFNNQSSQMYGGANSERKKSNAAVDDTRGKVLTYAGAILPSFYHATCGGVTRDASELWKVSLPPLDGGVKCATCWFSPHYSWNQSLTADELGQILKKHNIHVDEIRDVKVTTRSSSERALKIDIKGDSSVNVAAKDLRLWIGSSVIRSELFDVETIRKNIKFSGRGWGHGVGMCQWGALGLSLLRKNHAEILIFYYPGSQIEKLY
ncbi:MAG: stage II sporulation protein D [Candidatus Omnitrophota bacterium]|jgi:stage II sporulation protein D